HDVADGDDAQRLAVGQNRQMTVAAAVHLVQSIIERVAAVSRLGVASHEFAGGQVAVRLADADGLLEQVALAEDAEQLAVVADNEQGTDVTGEHGLDGRLELRGGADGDGPLGPQDADRIFHQTAFDAVGSDGPVERRQVLQAVAALFIARQVDVAAGWTDHGWISLLSRKWLSLHNPDVVAV